MAVQVIPVTGAVDDQGNFFEELLQTGTDIVDGFGDAFQNYVGAGAANNAINQATAAAIEERERRKTETTKDVMKIIVLTIVCITIVAVLFIGMKKIR